MCAQKRLLNSLSQTAQASWPPFAASPRQGEVPNPVRTPRHGPLTRSPVCRGPARPVRLPFSPQRPSTPLPQPLPASGKGSQANGGVRARVVGLLASLRIGGPVLRQAVSRRRSLKRLRLHAGNLVERLKGTDPNSTYTDYVSDTAVYDSYGQLRVCAATGPVVRSAPAYLILRRTPGELACITL